ncbi:hypothetical protein PHYPO_G00099120 [Pangasianodon hypophthalmus]|uniref:Uncharacterized protein n=1 Tax=Pangasianodon hypophthalmus TaxID=310915 RepID=A0A5N5LBV7_PANHP|nr:hypothetical protein PHYPO_G00099120 [Pangasianodon hypophthalmus]
MTRSTRAGDVISERRAAPACAVCVQCVCVYRGSELSCGVLLREMDLQVSVVLQVLSQASSQDSALLKPAEEQLRHWENQPGFYSILQHRILSSLALQTLCHRGQFSCGYMRLEVFHDSHDLTLRPLCSHCLSRPLSSAFSLCYSIVLHHC